MLLREILLEVELQGQHHNTTALLFSCGSENRVVDFARSGVKDQTRILSIVAERIERVIQEVESVKTELDTLGLTDLDVLEQAQIAIEEGWSENFRKYRAARLSPLPGDCKAAAVDELMLFESAARIAGQHRSDLDGWLLLPALR